ncbi:hypothetical protein HZU77_015745 [Neisseriaceae bacterium TC5R-5]|nr:hypothetical protein [Neisseriaceae bacterium TC5R-5]
MKKQSAQSKKRGGRKIIEWTLDEIRLLEQHYGTMLAVDLKQQHLPTRTVLAIQTRAHMLGLTKKGVGDWTEEELALLRQLFGSAPLQALQKQYFPQRTYGAVKVVCLKLGLRTLPKRRPWTKCEDALLREHYSTMVVAALQQRYLPERSVNMVRGRAEKLGLQPFHSSESWSESELAILQCEYPRMGKACSQLFPGRTTIAIIGKARMLGLERAVHIQWSEAEIEVLRREFPRQGLACVDLFPGRTQQGVVSKAQGLGITVRKSPTWSKEELTILQREYPRQGKACVSLLPGRTQPGVHAKAQQLKLVKGVAPHLLSKQDEPTSLPESAHELRSPIAPVKSEQAQRGQ